MSKKYRITMWKYDDDLCRNVIKTLTVDNCEETARDVAHLICNSQIFEKVKLTEKVEYTNEANLLTWEK